MAVKTTLIVDVSSPEHIKAAQDILASVCEGASTYWCQFKRSTTTIDKAGNVLSLGWVESDTDGPPNRHGKMTPTRLIAAVPVALADSQLKNRYVRSALTDLLFKPADLDYDATVADLLFQYAALGEVVYG